VGAPVSTFRVREGGVTATITGPDRAAWEAIVGKMGGAILAQMQAVAGRVASDAQASWYGPPEGVQRETGLSGQIEVVTTVDRGRAEVRVGVGSTDTRVVKNAKGRSAPVVVYIHRAGRSSLELIEVTREEHFATPKSLRFGFARREKDGRFVHAQRGQHGLPGGKWWVFRHSAGASDGARLYDALLRRPFRLAIKAGLPDMAKAITQAVR